MTWTLAVDGRAIAEDLGGFKRYTEQLLPAMCACDPSLRVHLLSHRALPEQWSEPPFSVQVISGKLSLPSRLLWERGIHRYIPRGTTAFFSPMGLVPRAPLPTAITVHDTAFHTHPALLPRRYRWYWQHIARRWPLADLVLAPSKATREGLAQLGIPSKRVVVTGEGSAGNLLAQGQPTPPSSLATFKDTLHADFVLFVGTIEPRKNLGTLLAAMGQLERAPRTPLVPLVPLVLAGRRGWGKVPDGLARRAPARGEAFNTDNGTLELGPVSDSELAYLYSQATVLAFPSWTEGFGLPALEAMGLGLPVIASNVGGLAEVIGNAGVLLPPYNVTLWAEGIGALLQDRVRRNELTERGLARARQFSWKATAQTTLSALRELGN